MKTFTKRQKIAIALFAIVALLISSFAVFSNKLLEFALARGGLEQSQIESIDFGINGTLLTNVRLPRIGVTIREIRLYATAGDLASARLGKVFVKGLSWQPPQAGSDQPSSGSTDLRTLLGALDTYSSEIEVDDINLTLAPDLPTVAGKGTIYDRGDRYQLNFEFSTAQTAATAQVFDIAATASADVFKKTGAAKAQVDVQQLSVDIPAALTAKRISGWATFELPADASSAPLVGAQLNAGALRVYDVPLTETSLTVSGDAQALNAVLAARLPEKSGTKAGNGLQAEMTLKHAGDTQALTASVTAKLDDLDTLGIAGVGGSANVNMQLAAQKDGAQFYGDINAYRDIAGTVNIDARNLSLAKAFSKANAKLAGTLGLADQKLSFVSTAPLTFAATRDGDAWSLAADKLALGYDMTQGSYHVVLGKAALAAPFVKLADGQADVTLMPAPLPVVAGTISASIESVNKPALFTPLKMTAQLASLSSQQHTTGFDVAINGLSGALMIKLEGKHDSAAARGDLRLRMVPIEMIEGVSSLEEFFPVSAQYVEGVTGTIGALARMQWHKDKGQWRVEQAGRLLLRDLGATYSGFPIVGINTVLSFDSLMPLTFQQQKLAVGAFTAGLPLQNGLLTLSLDKDRRLTVHDGQMDMAGGKVGVSPFTMDLVNQQADIVLTADNLDLKQLFAIAPLEGLSAEGRMQGRLPITMREGNLSLADGELSSIGGGAIRYSPKELPAFLADDTNQHIVDLRTALANFNFSSLKMGLRGDLLKDQTITLNIEGKNPDFYGGHPVKLNLNVEGPLENIVRYAPGNESIPDAIQKQIEQFEDANASAAP